MISSLFWFLIHISAIFPLAIGLLTIFYWVKTPKTPNDKSNRINNIISWWIGLTRPDVLGKAYKKFFENDVMDNINFIDKNQ